MKKALFVFGIALMQSGYIFANGITTKCVGSNGNHAYSLTIFVDSNIEGGYRFVDEYSGAYPTVSKELGTTRVIKENGSVLEALMTVKAYEIGDIPLFVSDISQSEVTIDFTDRNDIKATYLGSTLHCK